MRLSASHESVLVMASDGTLAADVRPLVRSNVSVIVEQGGRREQGYAGGGGRVELGWFRTTTCAEASRARPCAGAGRTSRR